MTVKKCRHGFTLIEALVVMAIISAGTATVAWGIRSWVPDFQLKGAARKLKSDLQFARLAAIKRNTSVVTAFNTGDNSYILYTDNGAGDLTKANNHIRDAGEQTLKSVQLGSGIRIMRAQFGSRKGCFAFNGRGAVNGLSGGIYLQNRLGRYRGVTVSRIGKLTIKTSTDGINWHRLN